MQATLQKDLIQSVDHIRQKMGKQFNAKIGLILGSGFAKFGEYPFEKSAAFELASIPHMFGPKVQGHGSKLIFAEIFGQQVCLLTGRIHLYESYSAAQVVYPIRLMHALGIQSVILTNASGGLTRRLQPGSVLVLNDQINLTGKNCLIETPLEFGTRFVDMVNCYDAAWRQKILQAQPELGEGVYVGVLGPTYETPAETEMFARLGGDVIGMSTVQEAIAARQLGMRVAGLSLVTNLCGGLSADVNHGEVLAMGKQRATYLQDILLATIKAAG